MQRWNRIFILNKKHYASEHKYEKIRQEYSGTKAFVYSFKLMDLESKMYVAFGMSLKSEKEVYQTPFLPPVPNLQPVLLKHGPNTGI